MRVKIANTGEEVTIIDKVGLYYRVKTKDGFEFWVRKYELLPIRKRRQRKRKAIIIKEGCK